MKLNYDCIRDALLELETLLELDHNGNPVPIRFCDFSPSMPDYDENTIYYALLNLEQVKYITMWHPEGPHQHRSKIIDINYKGHEFIHKISDDTVWNNVKKKCSQIGAITIPIISEIATSLLLNQIK